MSFIRRFCNKLWIETLAKFYRTWMPSSWLSIVIKYRTSTTADLNFVSKSPYSTLSRGGSRNFRSRGCCRILGVCGLYLCPFTYTLSFCSEFREEKKNYIHYTLTTLLKFMHVMQSILQKQTPIFFSKQRGARPVRQSWIRLCLVQWNPNPLQAFVSRKKTCFWWKYITYLTCFHLNVFFKLIQNFV